MSTERIIALIGDIYRAGVEPERWHPTLGSVCDELGAVGALMGYYDASDGSAETAANVRLDPEILELFLTQYVLNPWTVRVARDFEFEPVLSDRSVPLRELRRTPFYADVLKPQGITSALGANFVRGGATLGCLSLMYRDGPRAVDEDVHNRAGLLFGHVRRALELESRLQLSTARYLAAEEAIDHLRQGVVALDRRGRVTLINATARAIFAARDGLFIAGGLLTAVDPTAHQRLTRVTRAVLGLTDGRVCRVASDVEAPRTSGRIPYRVSVTPLHGAQLWPPAERPAALVYITDPQADFERSVESVAASFRLTPAETRVTLGIAAGCGLPEVARQLGIRLTTARTHLQHVFDKTGVRNQAALLKLIAHSSSACHAHVERTGNKAGGGSTP